MPPLGLKAAASDFSKGSESWKRLLQRFQADMHQSGLHAGKVATVMQMLDEDPVLEKASVCFCIIYKYLLSSFSQLVCNVALFGHVLFIISSKIMHQIELRCCVAAMLPLRLPCVVLWNCNVPIHP
jgi:hypothetical protein